MNEQHFWSKVRQTDGCWEWTGTKDRDGYGTYGMTPGRTRKAHRLVWALTHGDLPTDMQVCHTCDNPSCVNPAHLFLGTCADNMRDKVIKGRANQVREKNNHAKLTMEDAEQIRILRGRGMKLQEIAVQFGISIALVSNVANRKSWI